MNLLTVVCFMLSFILLLWLFAYICLYNEKKENISSQTRSSLLYLEQKHATELKSSNQLKSLKGSLLDINLKSQLFPSVPNHDPVTTQEKNISSN